MTATLKSARLRNSINRPRDNNNNDESLIIRLAPLGMEFAEKCSYKEVHRDHPVCDGF
jgi:hypothetical protein